MATRRSTISPISRWSMSARFIWPDMPSRSTTKAIACSSTVMTDRWRMRCGNCSKSSSAAAARSRRSSNGIATFPTGQCSRPKREPHNRSSTVTQHPSHPEKSMRVDERIGRRDGGRLSFAVAFCPALLDPQSETPAAVSGPNEKAAVRRYNVYRNNVTVSLIDALAAIFPATQRITGVEFFRALARFHVRATPPTSPLLFEYGRDFPAFIETYEYAQSLPWLADVARIERAWLDAYHAADAAPLSPAQLAAVAPERLGDLVFTPHPAAR